MKKIIVCFALVFSVCAARGDDKPKPLIVHEWGTFTSLQDEQGNAIGGINTDDEPVPAFVHRLGFNLIAPQTQTPALSVPGSGLKIAAISHCDPDVTMRLETPVIYFYPPVGWKAQPVDVHVSFPGGWLSEFYPDAVSKAPGYAPQPGNPIGHIGKDTIGELSWSDLVIGADSKKSGPLTTSKVWLAPRDVKSAPLYTPGGESEKFLFYRGVGNVDASLRIVRNSAGGLEIHNNTGSLAVQNPQESLRIHAAWLVDVRKDGACAFKSLGPLEFGNDIRATMPGSFTGSEYSSGNMPRLRDEMRAALMNEGLFADEAAALLNTWEISYFKSPGLRFFYLCPRAQIEAALPLQISVPSRVSRVMIGRIEIVTPEQRALLKGIAAGHNPVGKFLNGLAPFESWKNTAAKQDYFELGRFRNALVLDEQKHRPTAALNDFIATYDLGAYTTPPRTGMQSSLVSLTLLAASGLVVMGAFAMKRFRKSI